MPVTNGPNLGRIINAATGDVFDTDFRSLLRMVDVLLQGAVISKTLTAPPGSPANGDRYIVGASATGAWASHDKSIAVWTTDNPATPGGLWEFYAPKSGWLVVNIADGLAYVYLSSAWTALSGGGGGGSANINGDTHPSSPTAYDDEFEASSLAGIWTVHNSAPYVLTKGALKIPLTGTGGSINWRFLTQTPPASPYKVAAKIQAAAPGQNYIGTGILIYDSGSGKLIQFGTGFNGNWVLAVQRFTNSTTYASTSFSQAITDVYFPEGVPKYFLVEDDGTNFNFSWSVDGIVFTLFWSEAKNAFFSGGTYDGIGFGFDVEFSNTLKGEMACDWFREF